MEQEKTMNGTAGNGLEGLNNETMEGLIDHLKRNLKLQEQQPGNLVYTMLEPDFQDLYMCLTHSATSTGFTPKMNWPINLVRRT